MRTLDGLHEGISRQPNVFSTTRSHATCANILLYMCPKRFNRNSSVPKKYIASKRNDEAERMELSVTMVASLKVCFATKKCL